MARSEASQSASQIGSVWAVWGITQVEDWADEVELINGCLYVDREAAEYVAEISDPKFHDVRVEELPVNHHSMQAQREHFARLGGDPHAR